MRGRPKLPAEILNLHGAFEKDPNRERQDVEPTAEFDKMPPVHLPQELVPIWHQVVVRLPKISLSSSDEYAVEQCARSIYGIRTLDARQGIIDRLLAVKHLTAEDAVAIAEAMSGLSSEFKKYDDALRHWLTHLGMTPVARTKFATSGKKPDGNKFAKFKQNAAG